MGRDPQQIDLTDGGWSSRKLWFSICTSVAILVGGVAGARYSGFAALYPTMIGGLLASLAAYSGANIGATFVNGNHLVKMGAGTAAAAAEEPINLAALQHLPEQPTEQLPPDHDQET